MASIVLILSHPSLGYPEATVRTQLVGQSCNLWNVSGHGLGIFTLRGFGSGAAEGSGVACPGRNRPDFRLECSRGRAPLALEGTALTYLLGALLLRRLTLGARATAPLCLSQT